MKKIFFLAISQLQLIATLTAQNVGINTTTPTEKLDVNGNANFRNQIKINGDSGKANQVLMKDASNNLAWGDISEYKNLVVFDCSNIAGTTGTNNCTQGWTVPAGVTKVLIECWGGGGGGGGLTGGGGGGYISCTLTVAPSNTINFTLGAGGLYSSGGIPGIVGGTTSFSFGGYAYSATGGNGGASGDPSTQSTTIGNIPPGGSFSSIAPNNFIGFSGQSGGVSRLSFLQTSATEFARVVQYGDGGDAAMIPNSGAKGGYRFLSGTYSEIIYAPNAFSPGGGGGADFIGGEYGKGGRVVIHY